MRTLLPNGSIAPEPFTPCRQFGYCAHCWRAGLSGREIRNGFATQIGNANLAWFGTTQSKSSRLNFLDLLRGNYTERGQRCGAALHRVRARADHRSPGNEFDTFTDQPAAQQPVRSLISTPRQGDPLWMAIGIA